jgi:hypothetical protein
MSNVCAQMQFPLQNLVQYIRMDLEMSVGVGKGTDIWRFYMYIDFLWIKDILRLSST